MTKETILIYGLSEYQNLHLQKLITEGEIVWEVGGSPFSISTYNNTLIDILEDQYKQKFEFGKRNTIWESKETFCEFSKSWIN